ncbi:MAG: PaaI family thioesterase [Burkholderiales bacterium]
MPSEAFEFLQANVAAPPFHQLLKVELLDVDEATGAVRMRLPVRYDFLRDPARPEIHGGVIAAFADMAGHAVIAAQVRHGVPTIDMRVDYLRLAAGEFLIACGSLVKLGRSISVADVRILDDADRLVATGRGAYSSRSG